MEAKILSKQKEDLKEVLSATFSDAMAVTVEYDSFGALGCAVYPDGIREYMYVSYSCLQEYDQHEKAMRYVESYYGKEEQL